MSLTSKSARAYKWREHKRDSVAARGELTVQDKAEFRGFFYGEGSIVVYAKKNATPGTTYYVNLSIAQRIDNSGVLHWLRLHFGGTIFGPRRHGNSALSLDWHLNSRVEVRRALRILLEGDMPSPKRAQAVLALQISETTRESVPGKCTRYTSEEQQARLLLFNRLREEKRKQREGAYAA